MNSLIDDRDLMVSYCRDERQSEAINAILNSTELKKYINYIIKGNPQIDQKDILHDTIVSFVKSCMKPSFELQDSAIAYLKTIARNHCYMQFRKKKIRQDNLEALSPEELKNEAEYFDRKKIVKELLDKIGEDCKEVLYLWAMKFRMREIANKMDYGSESYAKKKKHNCLKKLVAYVESQPLLKDELKNYV